MKIFSYIFATFFGSGYFPFAPGTFGSLTTLFALIIIDKFFGFFGIGLFFVIFTTLGFFVSEKVAQFENKKDPSIVVIDETAGLSLSILICYGKPHYFILSFLIFRFFDIIKPLFIKKLEKVGSIGTGIMLDDLLAGFYAGLTILLVYKII